MRAASSDAGPTRTACCVTGQMRGYHISRLNWQRSTELRFLLGAAEHVDWFLVTSNTTSYQWYQQRVASQGSGFVETHVSSGCQRFVKADAPWIWRDAGTALEFNLNRFPFIHGNLHATLLVQHWQLAKCREMMQRREQALGVQYSRVVRIRTDVILGTMGTGVVQPNQQSGHAVQAKQDADSTEALPPWLRKLHTNSRKHWAVVHDWLMAGSRDVIFDVMMNGLHHLQDVKRLQGLQSAWKELRAKAYATYPAGTVEVFGCFGGEGCRLDLARSVGPPLNLYFLQESEASHGEFCAARHIEADECWRRFARAWHLEHEPIQELFNFSYSWPPSQCTNSTMIAASKGRNVGTCIARAHVQEFGAARIVGDPTHWDHGGAKVPGYSWANRGPCDAKDGWEIQ